MRRLAFVLSLLLLAALPAAADAKVRKGPSGRRVLQAADAAAAASTAR